jgi:L-aminopeptidase/D-esterase-like protein
VGKILGMGQAMKSGLGCAAVEIGAGLKVGAVVAVNAFGDVLDPYQQRIVAGARTLQEPALAYGAEGYFADTLRVMQAAAGGMPASPARQNTVIGVVVTNALLNKEQATKVAQMAQDGLARTVRPAHTMWDGDTIFTLAAGPLPADVNTVGACAAEVVAQAILNAVRAARGAAGLPAAGDFSGNL